MHPDAAQLLWRAVIRRALVDAAYTGSHPELARDKASARNWLLNGGPDFEIACMFAGFDPEVLRERFRAKKIKGQHLMEVQHHRRGRKPRQMSLFELLED
jgi:thiamine monophosphate kinase